MGLIALKCPHCGGDIQLDNANEFGFCMYCGSKVMLEEKLTQNVKIDESSKVESNLRMMREFFNSHDNAQALAYAMKVIDLDPTQGQAWFIRGICTGNATEKKLSLEKALELSTDADLKELIEKELQQLSDTANLRIALVAPDLIAFAIRVDVDGKEIAVTPTSPANVTLKKGRHTVNAKIVSSVGGRASKVIDLDKDDSVTVSMKKTMLSAKMTID